MRSESQSDLSRSQTITYYLNVGLSDLEPTKHHRQGTALPPPSFGVEALLLDQICRGWTDPIGLGSNREPR